MIITISGTPGSGKSTLGRLIAKKLGYKFYSMGDLRGKLALEKGLTINEYNKLGETEDTDTPVDKKLVELGKGDNLVFDSRTAYHLIKKSYKIFVDADIVARAERLLERPLEDESYPTIDEAKKAILERQESDRKRYKKHYDIIWDDKTNYDLVVDTTKTTAEEALEIILKEIQSRSSKA